MATEVGALFDEFATGGARLDDVDITVLSARFTTWDYKGKAAAVLALEIKSRLTDGTEPEAEYLSAGDLKFFVPSQDGKRAIPVGKQSKLNINTNAVAFLVSLMNADTRGQMAQRIRATDDISILDGLRVHVVQKAQPKRPGISALVGETDREKTQLQVEKVIAYPWEAAAPGVVVQAGTPAAQAVGATAGNGAAAPVGEAEINAAVTLLSIVTAAGGSIKKTAIAGKVFTHPDVAQMPAPARNALLGLITNEAFLVGQALGTMGLSYVPATGTISLAG